ncbi:MAG TPA: Cro/CI family transcriptional regulator [Beijerinckiaceae bacterium]|nr:Cro/CI family transcriptional regulator [Beijerinckiaceae bacterium]
MRDTGLEQAIRAAGGISSLARALGVAQPSVSNWSRIPAERVLAVEAITAVPRTTLRPDLYPVDAAADAVDPVDQARGQLYLLLANLLLKVPSDAVLADVAHLPQGAPGPIGEALGALAAAAREARAEAVGREHFDLFVGVGRGELVPFASYYRTGFLYERPLVKVREDLKILGLQRSDDLGEPEDGIGFLCEVMAGMALGRFAVPESYARGFFNRHLAPWAERFFADLEAAGAARFYRAVGRLGRSFIGLEREAFALDDDSHVAASIAHGTNSEGKHDHKAC